MARRKTFRAGDALSLADETKVGSQSLIFNDDEVVQLLRAAVEREGNQVAFARRRAVERTRLG